MTRERFDELVDQFEPNDFQDIYSDKAENYWAEYGSEMTEKDVVEFLKETRNEINNADECYEDEIFDDCCDRSDEIEDMNLGIEQMEHDAIHGRWEI